MNFSEKLDFLMNVTNTTNSSLALHIAVDASLISRFRRGERKPSKNENYLRTMASYFSSRCVKDYQRTALSDALRVPSTTLEGPEELEAQIYNWLSEESRDSNSVHGFLNEFSKFQFKKAPSPIASDALKVSTKDSWIEGSIFYGDEGKRSGVITFLTKVIENEKPQTLLLYSDENIEWLTGDVTFTNKWASLLGKVILTGNRIKIIHTVSRNLDEMLSAISQWMPIYMTGAVEPYYCPRKRDGIFRHTFFIAPLTAALTSTSVENKTANNPNFLFTDKKTVSSLTEEFNSYLSICRPLMAIFTNENRQTYLNTLSEFDREEAASIIKVESLSSLSIPSEVIRSIKERIDTKEKESIIYLEKRIEAFHKNLLKYPFIEFIRIPDLENIHNGKVRICLADLILQSELFYSPEEFVAHLQHIIYLLERYENYHVHLLSESEKQDYIIYVKDEVGVVIAKTSSPTVIFAINETNMTCAFWDSLNSMVYNTKHNASTRNNTIIKLKTFVRQVRQGDGSSRQGDGSSV